MSRLQAPGFSSRLKAPGFVRPSAPQTGNPVAAAPPSQVNHVFKRPQDVRSSGPVLNGPHLIQQTSYGGQIGLSSANDISQPRTTTNAQPRSQATKLRIPHKSTTPNQLPTSTHHGPSPYERGKPHTSHIPYVGKRRVTGSLKAPESKLSRPPMPQKARESVIMSRKSSTNTVPPSQSIQSNSTIQAVEPSAIESIPRSSMLPPSINRTASKPVKRQLIPSSKSQSKLGRPKSYTGGNTNTVSSQLKQPRNVKPKTDNLKTSNRRLSRSLQSIPGNSKAVKKNSDISKSMSQENLVGDSKTTLTVERRKSSSTKPTLTKASQMRAPQNKFGAVGIRPRVSTKGNALDMTVNISTPYQTVKTDKQHLKAIKISPISNPEQNPDTTFGVADTTTNQLLDETDIFETSNVAAPLLNATYNAPLVFNATYNADASVANELNRTNNAEVVLNRLEISSSEYLETSQPDDICNVSGVEANVLNKTTVLGSIPQEVEQTHALNETRVLDQTHVLNETRVLDQMHVLNETRVLDQTHVLSDTRVLDQTHLIENIEKEKLNESENEMFFMNDNTENFIDNVVMPEHLLMDTPRKSDETHFDNTHNESFSDDILKVIAAISSGIDTQTSHSIAISTSPIKELHQGLSVSPVKSSISAEKQLSEYDIIEPPSEQDKQKSSEVVDEGAVGNNVSVPNNNNNNELTVSGKSELDFCDDYFTTEQSQDTIVKEETVLQQNIDSHLITSTKTKPITIPRPTDLNIDTYAISNVISSPGNLSPQTPIKLNDDEFGGNINERCNTISLGMVNRRKHRSLRVGRSNTFGSQDLIAKFRTPREAHIVETLDGNVLMDNTTFLQFGNEVKAVKTNLLKLRRALLEADCPSPLMKPPLKRSNSAKVSSFGSEFPPLSPRSSVSSPMAVVDPLVLSEPTNISHHSKEKERTASTNSDISEDISTITVKYQDALRKLEEMEKELDTKDYTIKLLQTQLEQKDEDEQEMEEQNIMLQHEVGSLTERLQRLVNLAGVEEGDLFSSGSFKDDFELADHHMSSRTDILKRMYSKESND